MGLADATLTAHHLLPAAAVSDPDEYRPISRRGKLWIVVLAVTTAITITWMMLERVGAPPLVRPVIPDAAKPCAAGQTVDCVGGMASVIVTPPPASAPGSAR